MVAGGGGGDYCLGFEETELRLGLPGGNGEPGKGASKRGFSETIDLKLKLTTAAAAAAEGSACADAAADKLKRMTKQKEAVVASAAADPEKPPASKAQVVGWPPVRSYRKNILSVQSTKPASKEEGEKPGAAAPNAAAFVKVSMDGAPYLRKVDLKMYRSYQELSMALEKMFGSFTSGNCGSQLRDFVNENKLVDLPNGSEYAPTYEDKDGDWMLVGDVPWEMFVGSCKRLRIMKGSEAIGLAPRAMEKCKNKT